MKKQNLLFIPFILSMGMGLFSCNFGTGGNTQTFQNSPAVVDFNLEMGGIILGTPWGYLAAPSLNVSTGDCIYIQQFTIDYDNQPSASYYTATNIVEETVAPGQLVVGDADAIDDYTLALSNPGGMVDEYFNGRVFVWMSCKDNNPMFRMVYDLSDAQTNSVKNFYIQGKPSSTTENTDNVSTMQAFNLLGYIQQFGRDTTKTFKDFTTPYNFRYVKANMNYVSGVTDGKPTYSMLNSSDKPIEIYVFKN